MEKRIFKLLMITIIISIIISITGCINNEEIDIDYQQKFLGKWIVGDMIEGEEDSVIFYFYNNNSFYINLTQVDNQGKYITNTSWMRYEIKDQNIIMEIEGNKSPLDFSFSENYNILTLNEKDGSPTVLNKI
jgi:hypothetical protein